MKKIKTTVLILALITLQQAFSQEKIYLDKDWKKTTKENAHFYRIVEKKSDSLYFIKDFYINENLQMDGHFTNLEKETLHRTINWYNSNGVISITRNYKNGKLHGEFINYLKDGSVFSKGSYKDGVPYEGSINDLCGNPVFYSNYKEGVKLSETVFYKDSNLKAREIFFSEKPNRYNAYYPLFEVSYDKNNKLIDTLYYIKKSHMIDRGIKVNFYIDDAQASAIKIKETYKDSRLDGETIIYHKNGEIWLKGTYKDNKKYHGYFMGNAIQTQFENGIQVGDMIKYDKYFNIISTLSYKNGKPYNGVLKKFQKIVTYSNGELIEKKEFYDYKHQNIKKISTFNGEKINIEWYDKQGKLLGTGITQNDIPLDGMHIDYNNIRIYKDGKKNGIEKEFKTADREILSTKTLYQNDSIVWVKSRMPFKDEFFHCDYKDELPFSGIEFRYSTETHYKDGKKIKRVSYRKNHKTDKLAINFITFYDPKAKYTTVIKEIFYKNGKEYSLTYKNGMPYSGTLWRGVDRLETYKNGKREGLYRVYDGDKIIEEGNHVNDKIQGMVHYTPVARNSFMSDTPTSCNFDKSKPMDGTVSRSREITTYKDGKKHGVHTSYYYANGFTVKKVNYKNGIKEGKVTVSIDGKKIVEGIYKNDKPYSGSFYNMKTLKTETYLAGKKHGLFIEEFSYEITQTKKYNKSELLTEETIFIDTDSILGKGAYKNNKPYQGQFIKKLEAYNKFLIEPYQKGKKQGIARVLFIDHKGVQTVSATSYKKDKKHGEYQDSYLDDITLETKEVIGTYKNNKPYNGSFITKREDQLLIISNYKKGKKEGVEKYITKRDTYKLLYKNGEIVKGIQLELIKEKYRHRILEHHYTAGIKTKTTDGNLSVIYKEHGFVIDNFGFGKPPIKVEVLFKNTKKTAGLIKYYQDEKSGGKFQFKEGKLTSGKLKIETTNEEIFNNYTIEAKTDTIEMILNFDKKSRIKNKILVPNEIPKRLSYKDINLLLNGFFNIDNPNPKVKMRQYNLDGSLLATASIIDGKIIGTFIDFNENHEGKIRYTIRYQDKKGDRKTIKNLSFEEMLKELKKLEHEEKQ